MDFGEIINYILYAISGFCFGIFGSRYSVLASVKIREKISTEGISGLLSSLPQLLFILISFFVFPVLFISKTTVGGFFYCLVLIYFFSKGYKTYIQNR